MNKRILYAKAVYGEEEKKAVLTSLDNSWLAAGKTVSLFEKQIASLFNKKYALATNSGSSANLLAITALNLPEGSEVITPACTFATTVAPLIQNRLVPVFIDSVIGRYSINEQLIEGAINNNTKAIMVPQLIGGVANMVKLKELALKYSLYLIDDSCDTLAPEIGGQTAAFYSDITTTSFYGSHIITTMGTGGMVMTDSEEIIERLRSLVNWGRVGTDNEEFSERFNYQLDGIPYDAKFIYSGIGFNMKMTEAQAAFGLEQFKRLPDFLNIRRKNHERLTRYFIRYEDWFYKPWTYPEVRTNWLAYALTIKDQAPFSRYEFLKHLDSNGVQVRVLFSGNITRHPAYANVHYKIGGELKNADKIMKDGFLIGCHHGLTDRDIDYLIEVCEKFLTKYEYEN